MYRLTATAALLTATVGCGTSYERNIEPTFTRSCAAVECHSGDPGDESGLDLSAGNGYNAIIGVQALNSDLDYVVPGDPDSSYLFLKLTDAYVEFEHEGTLTDEGVPTTSMPPEDVLSIKELSTIEGWITDGAPQ